MHRDDQPIGKGQKFKMGAPLSDNPRLHRKMLEAQKTAVLEGIQAGYETVERGRQKLALIEDQLRGLKEVTL